MSAPQIHIETLPRSVRLLLLLGLMADSRVSRLDRFFVVAAAAGADGGSVLASRFRKLKAGLSDLARSYDIVILDPPPALGTISLAVMQAATSRSRLANCAATKNIGIVAHGSGARHFV